MKAANAFSETFFLMILYFYFFAQTFYIKKKKTDLKLGLSLI